MGDSIHMQVRWRACTLLLLVLAVAAIPVGGCHLMSTGRTLYDRQDIRIGIEPDASVSRSRHEALNNHPAALTQTEIESLLSVIQVSGWSGTLIGAFAPPRPIPLFTAKELSTIVGPLAAAFQEAKPTERIVFSLPKPDVAYSEDRTEGALFLRGRYLHVVVTDHSSVIRADTGGGEPKDIRDTKGLKLWIAAPAQAVLVPDAEEPQWAAFEPVHISLSVKDVMTLAQARRPVRTTQASTPRAPSTGSSSVMTSEGPNQADLQLQIRELTKSNLDLRERLDDQTKRMEQLNDQLDQLRLELDKAKSKKLPSRKSPAP
jgi:hypothetical protein